MMPVLLYKVGYLSDKALFGRQVTAGLLWSFLTNFAVVMNWEVFILLLDSSTRSNSKSGAVWCGPWILLSAAVVPMRLRFSNAVCGTVAVMAYRWRYRAVKKTLDQAYPTARSFFLRRVCVSKSSFVALYLYTIDAEFMFYEPRVGCNFEIAQKLKRYSLDPELFYPNFWNMAVE